MNLNLLVKKIFVALLILLFAEAAGHVSAQSQQWQKIVIGDSITVEFPGVPKKKETESKLGAVHAYVLNDGTALYMAMVQEDAMDAAANNLEIAEFYDGALRGIGGPVLSRHSFTVNGFPGIEVQFTTPNRPQLPAIKFMRVVVVNGTAYTQQFWTSTEQSENVANARRQFFSSFQPNVEKTTQVSEMVSTDSYAYRLGKLLGKLAVDGIVVFVGFILLRRFLRWSEKPKDAS